MGSKNEEVENTATDCLNGLAANFYDEGIIRLMKRLDKCLNCNGNYIEEYTYVASSSDIKIIWMNNIIFRS
jgi:hypothetical protein